MLYRKCMTDWPLLLSKGYWVDYACDERAWPVYITTFLLFGSLILFGALFPNLVGRAGAQDGPTRPDPMVAKHRRTFWALGIATWIVLCSVSLFVRTQTTFVATETSIIDTGCQFGRESVETYDRAQLTISYRYGRGKRVIDELYFKQYGKPRIRLPLPNSYLKNLSVIAPEALRAYVEMLMSEGKPVPEALKGL
jgi:hypothetical protein